MPHQKSRFKENQRKRERERDRMREWEYTLKYKGSMRRKDKEVEFGKESEINE